MGNGACGCLHAHKIRPIDVAVFREDELNKQLLSSCERDSASKVIACLQQGATNAADAFKYAYVNGKIRAATALVQEAKLPDVCYQEAVSFCCREGHPQFAKAVASTAIKRAENFLITENYILSAQANGHEHVASTLVSVRQHAVYAILKTNGM